MSRIEIRICGLGGQGVIMSGLVLGKAASLYENKWSTMIQSFGPEARGSTCSAQVVINDKSINYPYIKKADVFMAFSQAAYERFILELDEGGIIVYDSDLVTLDERLPQGVIARGIPGTKIAKEKFGKTYVFNMIMLGHLTASLDEVNAEAIKKAILDSVPPGTGELNLKAFEQGYSYKV